MPDITPSSAAPRTAKHLMTPGQPRARRQEPMSLSQVQRWVMSTLAVSTIMHMAAGLVLAAMYVEGVDRQIGLLVIAGAFGAVSAAVGLMIHQRSPLSWWLLVGALLPPVVGAFVVF